MATIDLGKIKFNWRGTYAGGTAYVPDDVVYYMDGSVGSSYMCVANTTGNAPSSGGTLHASWQYLAKGQATSPTTTQGDVIVRGASADARLAIGTAGQALKVNSSANGLEYGTAGGVIQVKSTTKTDSFSATSTSSYQDITGMSVDITPSQSGSKILVTVMLQLATSTSYGAHTIILARRVSGSDTYIVGDASGNRTRGTIHAVGTGSNYNYPASRHISYLDTHGQSTSTAITYKLVHYDPDGNNSMRVNGQLSYGNAAGTVTTISSITAMEIASGVL